MSEHSIDMRQDAANAVASARASRPEVGAPIRTVVASSNISAENQTRLEFGIMVWFGLLMILLDSVNPLRRHWHMARIQEFAVF